MHMILQIISESIYTLFRLGTLVGKTSLHDRFKQASFKFGHIVSEPSDIEYVKQKHKKLHNTKLLVRLGNVIAKRRRFIKHYKDRISEKREQENVSLASKPNLAASISGLALPRLEDITKMDELFECPICLTVQSFEDENAWQ
ncbi:hypothetical protein V8C35DRAFT_45723 [Trichoderma chlorosporum]